MVKWVTTDLNRCNMSPNWKEEVKIDFLTINPPVLIVLFGAAFELGRHEYLRFCVQSQTQEVLHLSGVF